MNHTRGRPKGRPFCSRGTFAACSLSGKHAGGKFPPPGTDASLNFRRRNSPRAENSLRPYSAMSRASRTQRGKAPPSRQGRSVCTFPAAAPPAPAARPRKTARSKTLFRTPAEKARIPWHPSLTFKPESGESCDPPPGTKNTAPSVHTELVYIIITICN